MVMYLYKYSGSVVPPHSSSALLSAPQWCTLWALLHSKGSLCVPHFAAMVPSLCLHTVTVPTHTLTVPLSIGINLVPIVHTVIVLLHSVIIPH